jgi:hypothetical protein
MDNQDILQRIQSLVDEEHRLRDVGEGHASDGASPEPDDRLARLRQVEEALDQCWDLLRQRQARRQYGQDPDGATVRPVPEVEGYQQ